MHSGSLVMLRVGVPKCRAVEGREQRAAQPAKATLP